MQKWEERVMSRKVKIYKVTKEVVLWEDKGRRFDLNSLLPLLIESRELKRQRPVNKNDSRETVSRIRVFDTS